MRFLEVFDEMKQGAKVKLPDWGGYWYWDNEKETIMIHTKDDEVLDIRDTNMVEYTTRNLLSEDWIIADDDAIPVLGGELNFNFGYAIKCLKKGLKVARRGWNGKNMFVFYIQPVSISLDEEEPVIQNYYRELINKGTDSVYFTGYFCMKDANDNIISGWLASQTDMLADDWYIV